MTNSNIQVDETEVSENQQTDIVEVTNLSKHYDDIIAVDDVSFSVRDGEFFSIIGPSGSGKTTLLRMLAGFEVPTRGTVKIDGMDCTAQPPYKRNTNMIFQNLALFPHLDVGKNIAYGLVEIGVDRGERRQLVDEVLRTVDLEGYQDRKITELSGGEQQRVALARGLVNEPSVLLLDEPLGSLDRKLKETMKLELKRIQERTNTTFIYVTHDQSVAMAMSDRITILNDGKIQQIDSPERIYSNPTNSFVADFTGATNIYKASLDGSDNGWATVSIDGQTLRGRVSESMPTDERSTANLVIRPEHVSVSTNQGRLAGTVTDRVYKGALVDLLVTIDTGSRTLQLEAEEHLEVVDGIDVGDSVFVDWKDENALVVGYHESQ
ncbi:ABC transporter ATP-binding protein [Haladaptatus halobius]|uniref:ABC transporter ATP-binding protein n=1 Tax=Haladaptatus halobius TaxID=2884875 RepID=UPI001D0B6A5A|nr:ABC transporter ATP-binding protein [Haladaptatus halobius]